MLLWGSFGRVEVQMEVSDTFPYMHICWLYMYIATKSVLLTRYMSIAISCVVYRAGHQIHPITTLRYVHLYVYSHTVALIFTPEFLGVHIIVACPS